MALKGTLKDLGIADIFQLLGQQAKSGLLVLRSAGAEVAVTLVSGAAAKADCPNRDEQARLGNLLTLAEVVPAATVDAALLQQQSHGQGSRLGDILVSMGAVDRATINEFVRLQAAETLARLFLWKDGTYEFTQSAPQPPEPGEPDPLRSEAVLMNGFRLLDEWASFQQAFPSMDMTLEVLQPLPAPGAASSEGDESDPLAGLDAALDGMEDSFGGDSVPVEERHVFDLVQPERSLRKIAAMSRLGDLETCRAALSLIKKGHLKAIPLPGMLPPPLPSAAGPTQPAPSSAPSQPPLTMQGTDVPLDDMFGDAVTLPASQVMAQQGDAGPTVVKEFATSPRVPHTDPEPTLPEPEPEVPPPQPTSSVEPPRDRTGQGLPMQRKPWWLRGILGVVRVVGWGVALAAVAGLFWLAGFSPDRLLKQDRVSIPARSALKNQVARMADEQLERALEVYHLRTGAYPERIEELVEHGLVDKSALKGPFERPYVYVRRADRYILIRPLH